MMDDEAHLRAIRADLDDNGPRLVYADVLTERGDPQGELIVVQCARARFEREGQAPTAEMRALVTRERELFDAHVKEWVNPFGLRRWWGDFERGFIARLSITILALRSKWPQFQRLPLREIVLRQSRRGVPTVEEVMWLAEEETPARELTLDTGTSRATFDFPLLKKLLAGVSKGDLGASLWSTELPHPLLLPAVRKLGLNYPTRAQLQAVTASQLALEELHFNVGTALLYEDMRAFVDSPSAENLRDLWAGFIHDEVAIALFEARRLPALRTLAATGVHRARFSPDVGARFSFAEFLPQLRTFRSDLMLDEHLVQTFATEMPELDALHNDRNAAPGGVEALLASCLPAKLRRLTLTGTGDVLPFEPASIVARTPFPRLSELTLSRFHISEKDAEALPPVAVFHPHMCQLGDGAAVALKRRWPYVRV